MVLGRLTNCTKCSHPRCCKISLWWSADKRHRTFSHRTAFIGTSTRHDPRPIQKADKRHQTFSHRTAFIGTSTQHDPRPIQKNCTQRSHPRCCKIGLWWSADKRHRTFSHRTAFIGTSTRHNPRPIQKADKRHQTFSHRTAFIGTSTQHDPRPIQKSDKLRTAPDVHVPRCVSKQTNYRQRTSVATRTL